MPMGSEEKPSKEPIPDVYTPAGFRALLASPAATITEIGGTHATEAFAYLRDAIMLARVGLVKHSCLTCQGGWMNGA